MLLWYNLASFAFSLTLIAKSESHGCLRRSSLISATKGYRLQGHVFRSFSVTSSTECGQRCLLEEQCESLNYQHASIDMGSVSCELNNSTTEKDRENIVEDPSTTYYYLMSQARPNKDTAARASQKRVFKSCLDVKTYNNTRTDGEYQLQISYPTCNKTIEVYCADMNITQPQEYLTLKAGAGNNFSKKDYVGSIKQSLWGSSRTEFSKIRINSDLTVQRGDYRFATITWFHNKKVYAAYATAADCRYHTCSSTKYGVFKMDLTGTGLRFVTPIEWNYGGYHGCTNKKPNQYSESSTKQVVSGRCGGYCGSCAPKTLSVVPVGC